MKKMLALALSLVMALSLAACSGQKTANTPTNNATPATNNTSNTDAAQPDETNAEEQAGDSLTVSIPEEYADRLTVLTQADMPSEDEHAKLLAYIAETKSIEAGEAQHPGEDWGDGWLISIVELDQIGYEARASQYRQGFDFFAKSTDGTKYYVKEFPSDVRLMRNEEEYNDESLAEWGELTEWAATVPDTFVAENVEAVVPFDFDIEALQGFTYDGEHAYYRYEVTEGENTSAATLTLGQPTGSENLWCVERVAYEYGEGQPDVILVFPAGWGENMTAADYYAQMQATVDADEPVTQEQAVQSFAESQLWTYGDTDMSHFTPVEAEG